MKLEELRFRYDYPADPADCPDGESAVAFERCIKAHMLSTAVQVVPDLFPDIHRAVSDVARFVLGSPDSVLTFVANSNEIQAVCIAPPQALKPFVILHAGLIRLLTTEELSFVIGHELGHFLLKHRVQNWHLDDLQGAARLRVLALQRTAEISADRIGFVACRDHDAALHALIKTATGLDSHHMRLDVSSFLHQYRCLRGDGVVLGQAESSHPLLLLRVKALLWFQLSDLYHAWSGKIGRAPFTTDHVEEQLHDELRAISGFDLSASNNDALTQCGMWGALLLFIEDGLLSKQEQQLLSDTYGQEPTRKAVKFAKQLGFDAVASKFGEALHVAQTLPPGERRKLVHALESASRDTGCSPMARALTMARKVLAP
jgi:hypothetical protein